MTMLVSRWCRFLRERCPIRARRAEAPTLRVCSRRGQARLRQPWHTGTTCVCHGCLSRGPLWGTDSKCLTTNTPLTLVAARSHLAATLGELHAKASPAFRVRLVGDRSAVLLHQFAGHEQAQAGA